MMLFVQGTRDNWGVVVTPSGNTPMTLSLPAFLGYPRGHRIDPETWCCMTAQDA